MRGLCVLYFRNGKQNVPLGAIGLCDDSLVANVVDMIDDDACVRFDHENGIPSDVLNDDDGFDYLRNDIQIVHVFALHDRAVLKILVVYIPTHTSSYLRDRPLVLRNCDARVIHLDLREYDLCKFPTGHEILLDQILPSVNLPGFEHPDDARGIPSLGPRWACNVGRRHVGVTPEEVAPLPIG